MKFGLAPVVFVATVIVGAAAPSFSQTQTVYEPSANDPRIIAVVDAQKRAEAAMGRGDWKAIEETYFAPDVVVHAPINRVVNLENIMGRLRNAQIAAEPGGERRIEFFGVRGDSVVVMGEEVYTPAGNAPNAGKVVHRRFTDIWKQYGGLWKLAIRQATVISVQ